MEKQSQTYSFQDFVDIVRQLRKKCPWDREQTLPSLRQSFLEEAYEVLDAINKNDYEELKKELGDILLHVVLQATIAEETGAFTLQDVITNEAEKMIRRHPHVFGTTHVENAEEVKQHWEEKKFSEGREFLFDGIPPELPALLKAQRVQEKASKVGFDWKEKQEVWKKVEEELAELQKAEATGIQEHIEEEFGDVLFSLVNYARFLNVKSELALQAATEKFIVRFRKIEETLRSQGKNVISASFEEMDSLWNFHKSEEQKNESAP